MSQMFFGNARVMLFTSDSGSTPPEPEGHAETRVKYTEASGVTPREQTFNIEGELTNSSIDNIGYIEEIDIGNTVTSIGNEAFYNYTNLMSVTIGNGVMSIGSYAFCNCSSLTNVTIGNSVTNIGQMTFWGCYSLTSMTFKGKTLAQVKNIEDGLANKYYPWGIEDTSIINVA